MPRGKYTRIPREIIYPVGPSIAYIPLTQGQFSLLHGEDGQAVGRHLWQASWNKATKSFYVARNTFVADQKYRRVYLARELMGEGIGSGMSVDHISCDSLNNHRYLNLRRATVHQNGCNRGPQANNVSGYKGVSWSSREGKWRASIYQHGKQFHVGYFSSKEDASAAYAETARELHGEFARAI